MKLINRLKFRWKYCYDPIAGEAEPCDLGNGLSCTVLYMSHPEEAERIVILRKLRALLFGYGEAWTFKKAFFEAMRTPAMLFLLIIIIAIYVGLKIFLFSLRG